MGLPWNEAKAQASAQDMFERMWDFKFTPPGRGLWVMGTNLVYQRGSASLQNCAFVSTENIGEDFAAPFTFLMDVSMLGVGCGGDTRGSGKARLQTPRFTDDVYVVTDDREGWVDLIKTILNSFTGRGQFPTKIDYSQVRGRGTPIKTFGGTASGPKPLHKLVENLTRLLLPTGVVAAWKVNEEDDWTRINEAQSEFVGSGDSYRISSAQIVDIFNYIGKAVVAGGVRRTAEIMFGEPDDEEFITLKQDQEALDDRRWASNNSIFGYVGMDYSHAARSMAVNGEPGIFWPENAKAFSRMGSPADNKDWRVGGCNPCVVGDSLIATDRGPRRADQLIGVPFRAFVDGKTYLSKTGMFQTGVKPVYQVRTREGPSLRVTADHEFVTAFKITAKKRYEDWVAAEDLAVGDKVVLNNLRTCETDSGSAPLRWEGRGTEAEGWLLGNLCGDGYFHKESESGKVQYWGTTKDVMLELAQGRIETLGGDPRYHKQRTGTEVEDRDTKVTGSRKLWELAPEYGINHEKDFVTDAMLTASSDFQTGFVRGFFDADGSVAGSQEKGVSVRLGLSNQQHLLTLQQMLLHLGINSVIYWDRREAGERLLPDGKGGLAPYHCRPQHELVVSNDNLPVFAERVGFDDPEKREKLTTLLGQYKRRLNRDRFVATVESVRYVGTEPVYDCTVEDVHRFGANGMVVHNCGEQSLESFELCCLVETYPAHHDTYEDYERTLKMAYLYAKSVTLVPTHDPRANAVMMRNRRIGCSMSGIVQAMAKFGRREFLNWCDGGYGYVQQLDRIYSDWLGVPLSIKTTSVKPSGTVSLLSGATPGIHYPHSEYYLRRVRVHGTSPLVDACKRAGYPVEPDAYADDTMVVAFPVKENHFVKGKANATVWEQFVNAVQMQEHWADNQVSVTVTFRPEEVKDLEAALESFETRLKAVSVLPLKDDSHGYKQPPYETITEAEYEAMVARLSPLDLSDSVHDTDDKFCSGDKCMLPTQ